MYEIEKEKWKETLEVKELKKPILPSKIEQEENSRSKSAKLRIFERIIEKETN